MTNIDIYTIEGVRLDLIESQKISFNFQFNNFGEITNRQCTYTNTFTLPATDTNKGVLRSLGRIKVIVSWGSDYFVGFLICRRELPDDKGFEVNFYTDLFNFAEAIKNKKINELDFSEYDFEWSLGEGASPNLTDYFEPTEGVVTLVEYQNIINNTNVKYDVSGTGVAGAVGIYFKTLIEKIYADAGWTYSGTVLTDDLFNRLVMPLCSRSGFEKEQLYVNVSSQQARQISGFASVTEITDMLTNEISDIYNRFDASVGYSNNVESTLLFKAQIRCSMPRGNGLGEVFFKIKQNGVDVLDSFSQSSYLENGQHVHNCIFYIGQGNINNVYTLHIVRATPFLATEIYSINMSVEAVELGTDLVLYGNPYNINANLPSISFADVLKVFYQLFFLIPVADTQNKHITLLHFDEIYNNKAEAIDISDLIDYKTVSVAKNPTDYAQKNYARYKKSEIMPFDLNRFRTINNDALPFEKDILNINILATDNFGVLLHDFSISRLDFANNDFRLVCVNAVDDIAKAITVNRPNTTTFDISKYNTVYFSQIPQQISSLALDYIFDTYYSNFFKMLNDYEKLDLQMIVKELNVNNVDLTKLYYIKERGAYYYLNSISNFTDRDNLTNSQLIKI